MTVQPDDDIIEVIVDSDGPEFEDADEQDGGA